MGNWTIWYTPKFNEESGKWHILEIAPDGSEAYHLFDTEEEALIAHKTMYMNAVFRKADEGTNERK
jgi:hypothetical protein